MFKNHWAKNIITRGNMNISAITKGFILPKFTYAIRKKGGGGLQYGESYGQLQRDLKDLKKKEEEIDAIIVYIDWDKKVNKNIKAYAKLIEKKIRAELIPFDKDKKIIINVELKKD